MIQVSAKDPENYTGELLVYIVRQPSKKKALICADKMVHREIGRVYGVGDFKAKEGQSLLFYPDRRKRRTQVRPLPARVLVVGIGKDDIDTESFRKAGGTIAKAAAKARVTELMVVIPAADDLLVADLAQGLTEGLLLGAYKFLKYKDCQDDDDVCGDVVKKIVLGAGKDTAAVRRGAKIGDITASAALRARDMANEPGNYWTPAHFAAAAEDLAATHAMGCSIIGKAEMKKLGMGGIIGVNQGSGLPPTLTELYYRSKNKKAPTLLLVGKGLTFDSGGISLKPGAGMQDMKYDMCGGAAVLAVMEAVGKLQPAGVNVVALIPSTENLPGPDALKPGDVITHYNGKTVEVINTDAEGRLILADALAYGVNKFKPDAVIDLATLTGAVIIGLGHHRTGLMGNDDDLAAEILRAGDTCGEPLWRLPLDKEYAKEIKSDIADMKNVGSRAAGTITAGCFLEKFVDNVKWAHLDIAGTAWDFTEKSYVPKGPSAVGVRTLIEFIRCWQG